VREVRESKPRVGRSELLVRNHGSNCIESRAAESFFDGDAKKPELSKLTKELDVETLGSIGGFGLRIDFALGERANELAKSAMLGSGIEQISHPADLTRTPADRKAAA
jgi:hypothetical protein